ncbi:kinase-like domain-containing protein [Aspergillus keveii]|uniref:non-specific serine/threonine protein kinase n=1 Tax=Aspergillus keveii TaxID=714993 RepID=A0ABR4GBM6_9EURO
MSEDKKSHIEEGTEVYRQGGFHPVYIDDVDLRPTQPDASTEFRALKILSASCYDGSQAPIFEREILTHLRNGDRDQHGYNHVCHLLDDFEHSGPNGTHVCLVFELLGETLRTFGAWFLESRLPSVVMRRFAIQLLLVLDFAHDHNVIHTDIKPDNIFVRFRDYSLVESGYLAHVPIPQQNRSEKQYTPIPSAPLRNDYFSEADHTRAADWADRHLTENIQPVALRSPEVLIRAPWTASTDFWNLGAIVLELYRAVRMFSGAVPPDGHYEVKEHLTEIEHLFGAFPKELLDQGDQELVKEVFGDDGRITDPWDMIRPQLASEEFMPGLEQEDREEFADWLRLAMRILPRERGSAEDLLRHPWLGALQ